MRRANSAGLKKRARLLGEYALCGDLFQKLLGQHALDDREERLDQNAQVVEITFLDAAPNLRAQFQRSTCADAGLKNLALGVTAQDFQPGLATGVDWPTCDGVTLITCTLDRRIASTTKRTFSEQNQALVNPGPSRLNTPKRQNIHGGIPTAINSLRAQLLSTTSCSPTSNPASFGKSAYLVARYEFVGEAELKDAFHKLFSTLGVDDEAAIVVLAKQRLQRLRLWSLQKYLPYASAKPGEDEIGKAARDFFAAEVLSGMLADPFDRQAQYPTVVADILRRGAEGLFMVARAQFRTLSKMACDLIAWAESKNCQSLVIVESALGNSLPTQVIQRIADARGVKAAVVEWGCPRNDRHWRGNTVKSAAKTLANDDRVRIADCILFVDDAFSGSRNPEDGVRAT